MGAKKTKKFIINLNPKTYNLGTKINLVVIFVVFFSISIITISGLAIFDNILREETFKHLQNLSYTKVESLNKEYKKFVQNAINEFNNESIQGAIKSLKETFASYENDCYETFYDDSLTDIKEGLKKIYKLDVMDAYVGDAPAMSSIFPSDKRALVLQYRFLTAGTNELEETEKVSSTNDYSGYDNAHAQYHEDFRIIAKNLAVKDIYLADPVSGDVFYSIKKNLAFASNLFSGEFQEGMLSTTFKEVAASLNTDFKTLSDYNRPVHGFFQPVAYLGFPIYEYGEKIAVVLLELDGSFFDNILYDTWLIQEKGSFEYNLISEDLLLRNNPRDFLVDKNKYLNNLSDLYKEASLRNRIAKQENLILTVGYDKKYKSDLNNNKKKKAIKDYSGNKIFVFSIPVSINSQQWLLLTKIDRKEAFEQLQLLKYISVVVFIVLIIVALLIAKSLRLSITKRLSQLLDSMAKLYRGEHSKEIQSNLKDVLGEAIETYNALNKRISSAVDFTFELSEGNYKVNFEAISENDLLGKSLNTLKDRLISNQAEQIKRQNQDEKQNWINEGIAKFNDLLRQSNDNFENLSYIIIEGLVAYLKANQGGIFMVEGSEKAEKRITLISSFAYNRRKYLKKEIEVGEGLVGSVYLEKKSVHLEKIPEEYLEITSGFGKAAPKSLYIVPLMVDEEVLGIIEIASFNKLEEHHIEFIERVAVSIAATFKTVKLNAQTTELLEESKKRASEIAQQEEEMRQNMEEMQATQEELARLRDQDEKRTKELQEKNVAGQKTIQALLDQMEGEVTLKNAQGVIIYANEASAKRFELTTQNMQGITDADIYPATFAEKEQEQDMKVIIESKEVKYSSSEKVGNKEVPYGVVKRPFLIHETNEYGILTIRKAL